METLLSLLLDCWDCMLTSTGLMASAFWLGGPKNWRIGHKCYWVQYSTKIKSNGNWVRQDGWEPFYECKNEQDALDQFNESDTKRFYSGQEPLEKNRFAKEQHKWYDGVKIHGVKVVEYKPEHYPDHVKEIKRNGNWDDENNQYSKKKYPWTNWTMGKTKRLNSK